MTTVFCAVANSPESASGRGRNSMRVGIIGVGMTAFRPSTPEYSWKELMFEAASRAYADAGVDPRTEVDSFVTCAEDYYEGFGIFDEFTPDQLGGALRPVCTVTGDGLQGLANAFMQIQTGLIDIAVVEAHSKASDILTLEGIIEHGLDPIWNKPLGGHPFLIAGLEADAFVRKTRTSVKALAAVVAKNRTNALRNPLAAYAAKVDADAGGHNAFFEQLARKFHSARAVANDDGSYGRLAGGRGLAADVETERAQFLLEVAGVLPKFFDALRFLLQNFE